jgi:murein DD-endopeptidase MepM/ murein hydrolase activator NlpD
MADELRFIRGRDASRLSRPGEELAATPSLVDDRGLAEGIAEQDLPHTETIVDQVPLADGLTPQQQAAAAERAAASTVSSRSEDETEEDPGSSTASTEATRPRRAYAPHYFTEREHQVYYHDVIVYIEGQNVTPFLSGHISVSYGSGAEPNKCDFTLDNAGHRFTLTPENIQLNRFRTPSGEDGRVVDFDYDESAKAAMFRRKRDLDYNPIDDESGGRRFPLHHWSTVFHKNDCVRVWIHNPASEFDEWIPVFTGYVVSKPISEDYITGRNTISISCADIRHLMSSMRVNSNNVLACLPSQQATQGADPTNQQPFTGLRIFSPQSNQQFSNSFFTDLVRSSQYANPWVSLPFPDLIAALTFVGDSQGLTDEADQTVDSRLQTARRREAAAIGERLSVLRQRVQAAGGSLDVLSTEEREEYEDLANQFRLLGGSLEDLQPAATSASDSPTDQPELDPTITQAREPGTTPVAPPGTSESDVSGVASQRIEYRRVQSNGSGRIGRMRPGVFPYDDEAVPTDPPRSYMHECYYPSVRDASTVRRWWTRWYNLCFFSSPRRHDPVSRTGEVQDSPVDHSAVYRRYWREREVHAAGRQTRREGLWQPDSQAVHMALPGIDTPFGDLIWEMATIAGQAVAQNHNWTTRLQLIVDACETVDYRFWVSGAGDLVFEFAQYDFNPRDYGPWQEVLTLDHHLKNESFDEEGGEVVTAVVVNGSYTGRADVSDPESFGRFIPNSVGIWSPSMASRHGLNVRVRSFPQIVNQDRLNQLASLEFQKLLAAADRYQIQIAFRPWLLINKPVFNKYRDRFALVENVSWQLPVTNGASVGHSPPTMNITLNYSRSFDELGVPRFITGGPSQPMYFGQRVGGDGQVLQTIQDRVSEFRSAIQSIESGSATVTAEQFRELREQYNAILPSRQDTYNVLEASLQGERTLPEGEEDERLIALRELDARVTELMASAGSMSETERQEALRELRAQADDVLQSLRDSGIEPRTSRSASAGVRPDVGVTGVRSTVQPLDEAERDSDPQGPEEPGPPCYPGDPNLFSAPTGAARRTYPLWAAFRSAIQSGQRRRVLESYAEGRLPDDQIPRGVGTWQFAGEFPRIVTSPFGARSGGWHPGVDIPMDLDEPVYAVADGVVFYISPEDGDGQGMGVGLIHKDGFCTFYRHQRRLADGVELGSAVKRHQVISYCGFSGTERRETMTHIHFETAAIKYSPTYDRYVPSQFPEVTRLRTTLEGVSASAVTAGQRLVNAVGSVTISMATISPELAQRFDLTFLPRRDGNFVLPRTFLFYSPVPQADPFSDATNPAAREPSRTDVISIQDYYRDWGLKGIPALRLPAEPRRFTTEPVPEVDSTATGVRLRRQQQARDAAVRRNERVLADLAEYTAQRDRQKALFAGAVAPDTCPPERYEGNVPRQPGEPLPDQARLTREMAEATYRSREG